MRSMIRRRGILLVPALLAGAGASAQGWQHIGPVQRVAKLADGVELTSGTAKIRITAFREGVFRVRAIPSGTFAMDASWAVIQPAEAPAIKIVDSAAEVRVVSGNVVAIAKKSPLLIRFEDMAGRVLLADEPSLPMAWSGSRVRVWKRLPADESYFGLGDKPGPMNRRDRSFVMWNTDAYGWQESTDPIYKDVPFFIGLRQGIAYGIFFDNTWRTSFDFGQQSQDFFSFGSEGGEINYYFFAGPEPKKVVESFTALVGRAPLPPLWTLGFQQSRYSYYPESRAYEIVRTFREKRIPADAIYFDIDYQQGNAPFTVNRGYFPHFEKMISDFKAQGFHTILITDLHVKHDPDHGYAPYDSGMKEDVFVKNPDGSVYIAPVWPGPSVFPDFTLTRVRDWWGGLYKDFAGMGVAGFWNDMNEPAIFETPTKTMPLDTVHRLDDGSKITHREAHNIMGIENVRATYDGLRKLRPNERPFVLTRAAYAGAQRYSATWTGDNTSSWNHLSMSTPQLLNLGLSGFPLAGDDIGGFIGSPTPDLLTRWIEVGAFNPIYRDHTGKGTADQEPWVHGPEYEAIRRKFIELRYRLLPYIYTGIEDSARTGLPLMRPLFLEYPQAPGISGNDHDFLFGRDLLAAPVVSERLDALMVQFPPGDWYDFWTGEKHSSKETLSLHPRLDEMPLYVRAGAILPMQPLVQFTDQKPDGPLDLRVYPGSDCSGALYQDDGHSFAYQRGELLRVNYSCAVAPGSITVASAVKQNNFKPWWNDADVTIFGFASAPKEIRRGDQAVHQWRYDTQSHSVTVSVPDAGGDWTIQVTF